MVVEDITFCNYTQFLVLWYNNPIKINVSWTNEVTKFAQISPYEIGKNRSIEIDGCLIYNYR